MLCCVKKTEKDDAKQWARMLPRLWKKGMGIEDEESKERQKKLIQMMEEEGEEDGTMDGMVGTINNPFIKKGFLYFDQDFCLMKEIYKKDIVTFLG